MPCIARYYTEAIRVPIPVALSVSVVEDFATFYISFVSPRNSLDTRQTFSARRGAGPGSRVDGEYYRNPIPCDGV